MKAGRVLLALIWVFGLAAPAPAAIEFTWSETVSTARITVPTLADVVSAEVVMVSEVALSSSAAEASVALAESGRKAYQENPPAVIIIAPNMAGRADLAAIRSRNRESRVKNEACK